MSNVKAKIDFTTDIAQCTDAECGRYALGNVQATPASDGVWLAATDGRKLAAVKVPGETDKQRMIPRSMLPLKKNQLPKKRDKAEFASAELNGQWESSWGAFDKTADPEGRYPKCDDIVKEIPAESIVLHVDASFVVQLQKALSAPNGDERGITLFITPDVKRGTPVEVPIPVMTESGIGVLMPLALGDRVGAASRIKLHNERAADYVAACRK